MAGTARRVTAVWRDGSPYEALVPQPVAAIAVPDGLGQAQARLAELDSEIAARPDARSRVRSLLEVEALPSRTIMELAAGRPVAPGAAVDKAVRRFNRACTDALRAPGLDWEAVLRAHRQLVPGGGELRPGVVWVGPAARPSEALYVPPPAAELPDLVADLASFLAREDVPPLASAAIAFAQLEFVHPFSDGNGRLGRWLVQTLPRRRGLVRTLVPPIGLYLAANVRDFVSASTAYREGDADAWCGYFGRSLIACADAVHRLLSD